MQGSHEQDLVVGYSVPSHKETGLRSRFHKKLGHPRVPAMASLVVVSGEPCIESCAVQKKQWL